MLRLLPALLILLLSSSCSGGAKDAPAAPMLSLPAPSALLEQLPKVGASTEAEVTRLGAEFEPTLLNQRAVVSGGDAVLSPQFSPPVQGGFSDLACALYRFNLATYDRDNSVQLRWGTPNAAGQTWIGLARMDTDRWEWHACPFDNGLEFADHAPYTAPGGDALVAIVMTGTDSYSLSEVRFGLPVPTNHELWFYLQTNLQVQQNVDDAIALVERAADAGYTTCVLADSKLDRIATIGSIYEPKLQQFDNACKANGVTLAPSLCGLGWAESILYQDVNLVEAQHFVDVPFVVNGDEADSVNDAVLLNGGFEDYTGDTFDDWNQVDGSGLSSFADTVEKRSGSASMRCEDFPSGQFGSNCRVRQLFTVEPWHHYVLSCWVKTDAVVPAGSMNFLVYEPAFKGLTYNAFPVASTQDWTQYHIAFNSQDHDYVTLQVGIWGGVSGRFWVDDMELANAGLVNVIRRDGAPLVITNIDKSVTFSEGSDYDYVSDPLAGQNPWPGAFDIYHARPTISIPPGSPISDGDTIFVSGYHAVSTDEGKTACCLSEDGVYDIITANFAKLKELIDPQTVLVAVDEHRVANWCASCQAMGLSSGGLLNYATNRIDGIAQTELPGCQIVTWSDMYDPDHNARPEYYLCNGSVENTFADNPPPSWDVANWRFFDYNGRTPDTTIEFFAGRGNGQILAGYYDTGNSADIGPWLDYSVGATGVYACMYTTWGGDYSELEDWAQAVKDWDLANQ